MMKFAVPSLIAAAAVASTSSASIIVFTNQFVWNFYANSDSAAQYTETFESATVGFQSSLTGAMGGVTWTFNAANGLYVDNVNSSRVVSTNAPGDALSLTLSPGVKGFAGNVYGTDASFNVVPSIVQLSLSDGTSYIGLVDSATAFVGFYSTTAAITGVTILAQPLPGGTNSVWPTFDNMTFAVVPAPGALALIGLAGLAGSRRRR
jgi:MYXO-CTERM domain-containing protein